MSLADIVHAGGGGKAEKEAVQVLWVEGDSLARFREKGGLLHFASLEELKVTEVEAEDEWEPLLRGEGASSAPLPPLQLRS